MQPIIELLVELGSDAGTWVESAYNWEDGDTLEKIPKNGVLYRYHPGTEPVVLTRDEAALLYKAVQHMTASKEFKAAVSKLKPNRRKLNG